MKEELEVSTGPTRGTIDVRAGTRGPSGGTGRTLYAERTAQPRFRRVIPVAWDADTSRASPELRDGLLVLTVPKQAPEKEKKGQT